MYRNGLGTRILVTVYSAVISWSLTWSWLTTSDIILLTVKWIGNYDIDNLPSTQGQYQCYCLRNGHPTLDPAYAKHKVLTSRLNGPTQRSSGGLSPVWKYLHCILGRILIGRFSEPHLNLSWRAVDTKYLIRERSGWSIVTVETENVSARCALSTMNIPHWVQTLQSTRNSRYAPMIFRWERRTSFCKTEESQCSLWIC